MKWHLPRTILWVNDLDSAATWFSKAFEMLPNTVSDDLMVFDLGYTALLITKDNSQPGIVENVHLATDDLQRAHTRFKLLAHNSLSKLKKNTIGELYFYLETPWHQHLWIWDNQSLETGTL